MNLSDSPDTVSSRSSFDNTYNTIQTTFLESKNFVHFGIFNEKNRHFLKVAIIVSALQSESSESVTFIEKFNMNVETSKGPFI